MLSRILAIIAPLLAVSTLFAQATRPAQTGPASGQLTATIVDVKGIVQVRDAEDAPWRTAKVGMTLPVGGECRTGPRSSITLTMPPDQVVMLDRLGTVQILEAFRDANRLQTNLGMKYGRVRYRVEAAGMEHDASIRSPGSALAVRGSDIELVDDVLDWRAVVYEGSARVRRHSGKATQLSDIRRRPETQPAVLASGDESPAEHEWKNAANPSSNEHFLTDDERRAVRVYSVIWPYVSIYPDFGIVRTAPLSAGTGRDGAGSGTLSFNLSWTSDPATGRFPDLDFFVLSPKGETLRTSGASAVPSGGRIRKDLFPDFGAAIATWDDSYPPGKFTYGVHYLGEGDPATYQIRVLLDGTQINASFVDTVNQLDRDVRYTIAVPPVGSQAVTPAAKAATTVKPVRQATPPARRPAATPMRAAAPQRRSR